MEEAMATKPYIIALEEHYLDSEVKQFGGPGAGPEIVSRLDAMGRLPVIDHIFPFDEVKPAFARLGHGPMGKVVIRVAG